jgi:hypothetical protein
VVARIVLLPNYNTGLHETPAAIPSATYGHRRMAAQPGEGESLSYLRWETEGIHWVPQVIGDITPDPAADPFRRYAFSDLVHGAGAIAVWNNARTGHAQSE